MPSTKRIRIGDILLQHHLINKEQLALAIEKQQQTGGKLGHTMVEMGFVEEGRLLQLLAEQLSLPFVDLKYFDFDSHVVKNLTEAYARRFRTIILKDNGVDYFIGMSDPQDLYAFDQVATQLKRPLTQALVRESDLLNAIDLLYRRGDEISGFAEALSEEVSGLSANMHVSDHLAGGLEGQGGEEAPVAKLLKSLFEDALQIHASDIHIEPDEKVLRIRQRLDGVLHEHIVEEKKIAPALTQHLKILAGLNIAEKRLPQDGRFQLNLKNHPVDVRLSTMPTAYGESVVMRLLDHATVRLKVDQLGMDAELTARLTTLIQKPHGMLLVTGPTGSGKTTTLYSILNELNTPGKKIITVEDPMEYHLPRITQVQVNAKIHLDFARVLRSALRQDPDILMVGEIRDQETAAIALRASMTGHLVLTTLHTNDAVSSAMRLVDMGLPGYLVASAVKAVLAQRLVRRICDSCSKSYTPDAQEKSWLANFLSHDVAKLNLKKGTGCSLCHQSGYHGRVGVYELLEFNSAMLTALRCNDNNGFIHAATATKHYRPLGLRALDLALKGIITIDEVFRLSGELEDERNATGTPADLTA